jgi:hypothetical protein
MGKELRVLLRNSVITSLIILVYGIISLDKLILIATFGGSLVSIFTLYLTIKDAEVSVISQNATKIAALGYAKRYFIYGVFLFIVVKIFGFSGVVLGGLGLLNVKFNILMFGVKGFIHKLKHGLKN